MVPSDFPPWLMHLKDWIHKGPFIKQLIYEMCRGWNKENNELVNPSSENL